MQNTSQSEPISTATRHLRDIENIARLVCHNNQLADKFQAVRYAVQDISEHRTEQSRPSQNTSTIDRRALRKTVQENCNRIRETLQAETQHLRKTGELQKGEHLNSLSGEITSLEAMLCSLFTRTLPKGIYGILGEKFSRGRSNIATAQLMVDAGIDVLQYREKLTDKSLKIILSECRQIRKITADAGVPFIINDYADIALLVNADGIHQGQDDLPVKELSRIAPHMLLGCSTHSPDQAQKAVADGADYIGVGPVYSTKTKIDVCAAVGLEYLEYVVANIKLPFVAIGGIKKYNVHEIVSRGARTVCLVTEIIGAENIAQQIKEIREIIKLHEK